MLPFLMLGLLVCDPGYLPKTKRDPEKSWHGALNGLRTLVGQLDRGMCCLHPCSVWWACDEARIQGVSQAHRPSHGEETLQWKNRNPQNTQGAKSALRKSV